MPGDVWQRARNVLAQLALISEGSATRWDPAHGQPDSRAPASIDVIDRDRLSAREDRPPPKARSLYDHWRWRFQRTWLDAERLLYWVLLAEQDLENAHKTPPRGEELLTGDRKTGAILAHRASPAEVAAREKVTMQHVRTLREQHRRDPETGEPWLWPKPGENGMSPEARGRLKAEALETARALGREGQSMRRISQRTGIPRRTLSRLLPDP